MNDWAAIVKLGLRDGTVWLAIVAFLFCLRSLMDGVARWSRRHGWRWLLDDEAHLDESCHPPSPKVERWLAFFFAAFPVGWGLFRLAQGRYAQRAGGRLHPNPPVYLYEGAAAAADALSWIVGGIAIYLAFAYWSSRRHRWVAMAFAVILTYAAGVLHQGALAGRIYLR